jgi:hypothetical protein
MNGPGMNNPTVPAAPAANGPVRIGREYTGKHRREPGPLSPWSRAEPDTRPSTGTAPPAEGGP